MNTHETAPSTAPGPHPEARLYEVWGDTIDSRHLAGAIAIGAAVSLGAFLLAERLFLGLVDSSQMARAYAMLVGILGCLAGGAISAMLFKPKRRVVEHVADAAWRERALRELEAEYGGLGELRDLPPEVLAELKEVQLYDLFAQAHGAAEKRAPAAAPAMGGAA
ncbi:hypothetical protein SAMN05216189_1003110 [Pseudomonas delhiensis]|uniref:Uncharacterized protein n=1 Tax=Pseudomonas delhiensis TaxID=366289 RepID=A0A239LZW0_9PSED|nr:hypothetical protein [Pseudomonas delhiensis]SDI23478.1 hypothetical protein SAMN05216189_1003110 [Pseudomonas delhiensis]SNT35179.1 hypothetical protein SAMN06295949_122107 [Pseudomonas delhiensis]